MADSVDTAQQEIDYLQAIALTRSKREEVTPTDECVECGNEINEARRKAIKTNLCIGCAEVRELRSRHYATHR